jgi:hypothetical protein
LNGGQINGDREGAAPAAAGKEGRQEERSESIQVHLFGAR